MTSKNYLENHSIRKDIEPLYISAFPEEERPPVEMFFRCANQDNFKIIGFYEGEHFIGFTTLIYYKDLCYVFFLAVTPNKRGLGYGSKILSEIKNSNPDKVVFLCFEEVDKKYLDYDNRVKRREFYIHNGFKDNNLKTEEYYVNYDVYYYGNHKVEFDDYLALYISVFGDRVKEIVKKIN